MENVEHHLQYLSGISKRMFMALSSMRARPAQLEDALFQMSSVVDATSKIHFPGQQSSKRRFVDYIDSVMTDVFLIATNGAWRFENVTFIPSAGVERSFGEIIYGIRCSSYHDPEEVDGLICWGAPNKFGHQDGRFIINQPLLMSLFLVLLSDEANRERIDRDLFDDDNFLRIEDQQIPLKRFIGSREQLFSALKITRDPPAENPA